MNRNLVVGGILFALVLAALSVGIATFLVNRDIDAINARVEALAGADTPSTPAPSAPSEPPASPAAYLPVSGGVADRLSATGFLWSRGDLYVTEADDDYLFSVDATDGVRVYSSQGLTVDEALTVAGLSRLGDVDSAGRITAAGLIEGRSFANASGSFKVDAEGAVQTGRLVADGQATFNGGVAVARGQVFQIGGDTGNRVRWDPATGQFVIVGAVVVNKVEGPKGEKLIQGDIQIDSLALSSGLGSWDASGTLSTQKLVVADDSFKVGSGRFVVDAAGASLDGTLKLPGGVTPTSGTMTVNGDIVTSGTIRGATIDGTFVGTIDSDVDVNNNTVTAKQRLRVGTSPSYVFQVDNAGNVSASGDLTVSGKGTFGSLEVHGSTTLDALTATSVTAGNLPSVVKFGRARVTGGAETVTVTGMPSTASVVVTPLFDAGGNYYVDVAAGQFTISGSNGDYCWIAAW